MECAMQDFIRDENIKLYRRALAEGADDEQRKVLLVLLQVLVVEQAALASQRNEIAPEACPHN
jgi:hypothetical protein